MRGQRMARKRGVGEQRREARSRAIAEQARSRASSAGAVAGALARKPASAACQIVADLARAGLGADRRSGVRPRMRSA